MADATVLDESYETTLGNEMAYVDEFRTSTHPISFFFRTSKSFLRKKPANQLMLRPGLTPMTWGPFPVCVLYRRTMGLEAARNMGKIGRIARERRACVKANLRSGEVNRRRCKDSVDGVVV